jgi:hypothetical protein
VETALKRVHRILHPVDIWIRKACKIFHTKDADELASALEPSTKEPDWKAIGVKRAASAKHAAKPNAKFCKCREAEKGNMISCNVCEAWFHCRCLSIPARDAPYTRLVCKDCLPCRKPSMSQCQELISRMRTLPVQVKQAALLGQLVMKANAWMQSAAAIMAAATSKPAEELERICLQADLLPIELSKLVRPCSGSVLSLLVVSSRRDQQSGSEMRLGRRVAASKRSQAYSCKHGRSG